MNEKLIDILSWNSYKFLYIYIYKRDTEKDFNKPYQCHQEFEKKDIKKYKRYLLYKR